MSKIDVLYAKEIVALSLIIVSAVSSVMFLFRLFAYADYIFLSQNGLSTLVLFIVFLFPQIFKLTIPISLLLASLIVTLRMSQDREIEALMANGASIFRLVRAPTVLGFGAFLISLYTGLYLEPFSREQLSKFKWVQTVNGLESFIESKLDDKTFLTDLFPLDEIDVSLYVESLKEDRGSFEGVMLALSNPKFSEKEDLVLVAKEGSIKKELEGQFPDYVFTVKNGRMYQPSQVDHAKLDGTHFGLEFSQDFVGPLKEADSLLVQRGGDWEVFQFDEMKLSFFSMFRKQTLLSGESETDIRTLGPGDYFRELRKRRASKQWGSNKRFVRDHTYFYEAATVPLSCLFLPIVGICLGVSDPRRKPGYAYLALGSVLFLYYATVMICQQLALRFWVAPELTLIVPPATIVCVTGVLLRWRLIFPPSTSFFESLRQDFAKIKCSIENVWGKQR